MRTEQEQKAWTAWNTQRRVTKGRIDKKGKLIQFLLTFEEWLNLWIASGRFAQRGRGRGKYVMTRPGDLGNYEVGNVFIKLHGENLAEAQLGRKKTDAERAKISKTRTAQIRGEYVTPAKRTGPQRPTLTPTHCANIAKGQAESAVTCKHCGESYPSSHHTRWHGDNCKKNPDYVKPPKQKYSPQPILTCPHCSKSGAACNIRRSHFDKCKLKPVGH